MNKTLPRGYRISQHIIWSDPGDAYDPGEWTFKLEVFETRTVGHLWWKRPHTGWWVVEYNNDRDALAQTADLMENSRD